MDILQLIFLFAMPVLILRTEATIRLVQILSPVVMCYGVGILVANQPWLALNDRLTNQIAQAVVVLAIPMLLFPSDLRGFMKMAPATAASFAMAVFSICAMSILGVFVFGDSVTNSWMISAMLIGVYTGGTPNMTAIALSLEVPEETFILVNAADLFLGSIYLLFLMTVAKKVLKRLYPAFPEDTNSVVTKLQGDLEKATLIRSVCAAFLLSALIVGLSIATSFLFTGGESAPVVILTLTTLAIGASFSPKVRSLQGSYDFGQYLMLVFCLSIGAMADVNALVQAMSSILGYATFILVGSIVIHLILAKLFKIDVDTLIITTTAAVFGPPFIGPIAKVIGNRAVVVGGMTAGVIGLAIGNYLGYGIGILLKP